MTRVDLLGRPVSASDERLLALYTSLKEAAVDPDLPPCVERNVKKALACMWQVVNDLNLEFEQIYDAGV